MSSTAICQRVSRRSLTRRCVNLVVMMALAGQLGLRMGSCSLGATSCDGDSYGWI